MLGRWKIDTEILDLKMKNRKKQIYRHLKIWQIANQFSDDVFKIIAEFPIQEKQDLRSQLNRCAISKPSNIAEEPARTNKSFSTFIDISLGTSFELVTHLIMANNRNYLSNKKLE